MESEEPGHDEYRYDIGPIEHDPFILISYLSAKYEEFTFEQVKPELDALFAEQYHLTTEAVNETVTETATVRVENLWDRLLPVAIATAQSVVVFGAEDRLPVEHIQLPIIP